MFRYDNYFRAPFAAWGGVEPFFRDFERLLSDLDGSQSSASGNYPQLNMRNEEGRYVVAVDLPGVEDKDVDVNIHRGVVTINAERKDSAPEGYKAVRKERGALRWTQSFKLPEEVDETGIQAEMKDGVLSVSLPKRPEVQPKQIPVSVH